jgi:hypothetical protein
MITILIKVALLILLIVIMVLIGKTYSYFDMLPESNKFKSWLACDILALVGILIYIGLRLICSK